MKIIYSLSLLTSLAFSSISFGRTYVIKSGNHFSNFKLPTVVTTKYFSFRAKFDDSAEYYLGTDDQYDINKLYGFSDCGSIHHKNSARFGWVWNDRASNLRGRGRLEIYAYTYHKGKRNSQFITSVDLNVFNSYNIKVNKNNYIMSVNNFSVTMPRGCDSSNPIGVKLYPYFGGNEVAPHDVRIEIKD
jgi:hypothetical protein